jgi:quercetin dioxygenase-like cupin family protein
MARTTFLKFDSLPTKDRGDGIVTSTIARKEIGARQMRSGVTRIRVGGVVPAHSHNCEEQVTLLEGEMKVETDGNEYLLRPYDSTFISAGVSHRFTNMGKSPVLLFFVYGAADATRTFTDTGETVDHVSERDTVPPPPLTRHQ